MKIIHSLIAEETVHKAQFARKKVPKWAEQSALGIATTLRLDDRGELGALVGASVFFKDLPDPIQACIIEAIEATEVLLDTFNTEDEKRTVQGGITFLKRSLGVAV